MSVTLSIICPPDSVEVEALSGDNLLDLLADRYTGFPEHARIYDGAVSTSTDITPSTMLAKDGSVVVNQSDIDRLAGFSGHAILVEYPAFEITLKQVFLFIASLLATIALRPKKPEIPLQQTPTAGIDSRSSSNQLSGRSNRARPLARIPDIYGTVRVTPDLIGRPIRSYIGTIETETSIMVIGRGEFDVSDIKEGQTPVAEIPGASVSIFGPGTNLHNLPIPQVRIGSSYAPIDIVRQSNAINGQTLEPNNATNLRSEARIGEFGMDVTIEILSGGAEAFAVGDTISVDIPYDRNIPFFINEGERGGPAHWVHRGYGQSRERLHGDFHIVSFDPNNRNRVKITADINPVTRSSPHESGGGTARATDTFTSGIGSALLVTTTVTERWVGPFQFSKSPNGQAQTLVFNFVAPQGLYRTSNTQDIKIDVQVELEFMYWHDDGRLLVLEDGTSKFTTHFIIPGSASDKRRLGSTLNYFTAVSLRGQVRVRRITNTEYSNDFRQTDTVLLDSLYITTPLLPTDHFGDVTFVVATIPANPESVVIRDRKLNMQVTRKLPIISDDGMSVGTENLPTNRAIDALHSMTIDSSIGRRTAAHLNLPNFAAVNTDLAVYFGNPIMREFSTIFDDRSQSYEDMVQIVAQAIFCIPYRRGGVLNLSFDKLGRDPKLLLNDRNTLPGTVVRTTQIETEDDRDGIEFTYVSPETDTQEVWSIPAEGAINPRRTDGIGIRSLEQAEIHANRLYNRLLYQDTVDEREVTEEAALFVTNDILICADNTRPETQNGDILGVNGLALTLSQPVILEASESYVIFLQLDDGTVQSIPITAGPTDRHVLLAPAPALRRPLVTDSDSFARSTFEIVKADDSDLSRFILTERSNAGRGRFGIQCINYDPKYYAGDQRRRIS